MLDVYKHSRGKGLTDLPLQRPIPRRLSNLLICDVLWMVLGLVLLTGCASVPVQTETYRVREAVLVLTTDAALIQRACYGAMIYADGEIVGCYVSTMQPPALYCPPDNAEICWHELFLHHIQGVRH